MQIIGEDPTGLFERIPQMRETAGYPENLFTETRKLDKDTDGPIAPRRHLGERAPTHGLLLPVLKFKQAQPNGMSSIFYTYLHSLEGGRTLRKLTIEFSLAELMRQEDLVALQPTVVGSFEGIVSRFFPLCDGVLTSGLRALAPHEVIGTDPDGTQVRTVRTPLYMMFVVDDSTMKAPSAPDHNRKRSGVVLLGPDGKPARR